MEKKMREITPQDNPIVFHFRVKLVKLDEFESRGGATVVFLPSRNRMGIALCCGKDNYCKKWGRLTASARADKGGNNHRFLSMQGYSGPSNFEAIKQAARKMVMEAAERVDNPVWKKAWMDI